MGPRGERDAGSPEEYGGGEGEETTVTVSAFPSAFTYNHDLDHPYFAPRTGFVRTHVKYQGLVGISEEVGKTRLTWLVNVHRELSSGSLLRVLRFSSSALVDIERVTINEKLLLPLSLKKKFFDFMVQ